jgi:hypothetical protein
MQEEEEEEETNLSEERTNASTDPTLTIVTIDRPSTNITSRPNPTIPIYAAYSTSGEAFQTPPKRRLFIFSPCLNDAFTCHDKQPTTATTQSSVPTNSNDQDDHDSIPVVLPFFRIPPLFWSKCKQMLLRAITLAKLPTPSNYLTTTTNPTTADTTTTEEDKQTKKLTSPFKELQLLL